MFVAIHIEANARDDARHDAAAFNPLAAGSGFDGARRKADGVTCTPPVLQGNRRLPTLVPESSRSDDAPYKPVARLLK